MPERVTILEDKGIILVESFGTISVEEIRSSLDQVIKIQQETGLKKLLVDGTKERSLPETFPLYEFSEDLAKSLRGTQIAVITSLFTHEDLSFMETVIANRGGQIKVFDDYDEAVIWLSER